MGLIHFYKRIKLILVKTNFFKKLVKMVNLVEEPVIDHVIKKKKNKKRKLDQEVLVQETVLDENFNPDEKVKKKKKKNKENKPVELEEKQPTKAVEIDEPVKK